VKGRMPFIWPLCEVDHKQLGRMLYLLVCNTVNVYRKSVVNTINFTSATVLFLCVVFFFLQSVSI
jgi:hypothetical protein